MNHTLQLVSAASLSTKRSQATSLDKEDLSLILEGKAPEPGRRKRIRKTKQGCGKKEHRLGGLLSRQGSDRENSADFQNTQSQTLRIGTDQLRGGSTLAKCVSKFPRDSNSAKHDIQIQILSTPLPESRESNCHYNGCQDTSSYLLSKQYISFDALQFCSLQTEVTKNYRNRVVNLIVKLSRCLKLSSFTVHQAIELMDRMLILTSVQSNILVVLGVTCLFMSAKYEQVVTPPVCDYVGYCNNSFSKHDILNTESWVLLTLSFNLPYVSPLHFINQMCHLPTGVSEQSIQICEILLYDIEFKQYKPSLLALNATLISMDKLGFQCQAPSRDSIGCQCRQRMEAFLVRFQKQKVPQTVEVSGRQAK